MKRLIAAMFVIALMALTAAAQAGGSKKPSPKPTPPGGKPTPRPSVASIPRASPGATPEINPVSFVPAVFTLRNHSVVVLLQQPLGNVGLPCRRRTEHGPPSVDLERPRSPGHFDSVLSRDHQLVHLDFLACLVLKRHATDSIQSQENFLNDTFGGSHNG